jgi:hypothetical protein
MFGRTHPWRLVFKPLPGGSYAKHYLQVNVQADFQSTFNLNVPGVVVWRMRCTFFFFALFLKQLGIVIPGILELKLLLLCTIMFLL